MDPLVTVEQFTGAFPRDLTEDEAKRVPDLLSRASNKLRDYCRRQFTAGTVVNRLRPLGDQVRLPNPPVTGITSVKVVNFDGSLIPLAGWVWDGGQILHGIAGFGSIMINGPAYFDDIDEYAYTPMVEVTYTVGSANPAPQTALDIVIDMVADVLNSPTDVEGVVAQSSGPFSVQYSRNSNGTPGLTPKLSDEQKKQLRDAGLVTRTSTTLALSE